MLAPRLTRVASRRLPALTQTRTRAYATPSGDAKDPNAKDGEDAKGAPPTETGAGGYYFYANTSNPVEVEARRADAHAHRAAELAMAEAREEAAAVADSARAAVGAAEPGSRA
ncbi:hypothetical protein CspHIS471_0208790 [Cutaneotrichosporon sp. HIS471]|nr:hypothetical protein CspHIS471_0208790 [Cutaneotrichosporon sp. HIS471]